MRSFWDQLSHYNHCTGEFISISRFFLSRNNVTHFIYKLQIWEAAGKRLKSDLGSSPKSLTSWMTLRKLTCFWALLSVNKIRLPPTQTARIKWCVPFTIKSSTNACPPSLHLSEIPVFFQDLYLLKEDKGSKHKGSKHLGSDTSLISTLIMTKQKALRIETCLLKMYKFWRFC